MTKTKKADKKAIDTVQERYKRFADNYLVTLNATQAYKDTYGDVTQGTAEVQGCRLLSNPRVKSIIVSKLKDAGLDDTLSKEYLVTRLEMETHSDKASDRLRALELISKISGILKPDTNVNVGIINGEVDIEGIMKDRLSKSRECVVSEDNVG